MNDCTIVSHIKPISDEKCWSLKRFVHTTLNRGATRTPKFWHLLCRVLPPSAPSVRSTPEASSWHKPTLSPDPPLLPAPKAAGLIASKFHVYNHSISWLSRKSSNSTGLTPSLHFYTPNLASPVISIHSVAQARTLAILDTSLPPTTTSPGARKVNTEHSRAAVVEAEDQDTGSQSWPRGKTEHR